MVACGFSPLAAGLENPLKFRTGCWDGELPWLESGSLPTGNSMCSPNGWIERWLCR